MKENDLEEKSFFFFFLLSLQDWPNEFFFHIGPWKASWKDHITILLINSVIFLVLILLNIETPLKFVDDCLSVETDHVAFSDFPPTSLST